MDTLRAKLYAILWLLKKEILVTLKDPRSRIVLIIPVFLQGVLFGYTATFNLNSIPYAALDMSHSQYSEDFYAKLDGTGIFKRVVTLQSTSQIASAIDDGEAMAVITVNSDFADNLVNQKKADVQVITDGRNPVTSGLIQSYVASVAGMYQQQLNGREPLINVDTRIWYNPNLITQWMFLPSMMPMLALTQVMILAGLSVARERENGTFDQLLVTPLEPLEILIGKAGLPLLVGLTHGTIMLALATLWFHVPMVGSIIVLYVTLLVFLLSVIGIGLSVSAVSSTMQQVMVYSFSLLLPMILLSGMTTPISTMPTIMQYATYINPMRFAVEAIRRIYLEGAGFGLIIDTYIPMLIVAAITLPLAAWLFHNKLS